MTPGSMLDRIYDPVEMLNQLLEHAWATLCDTYDVTAAIPEMGALFEGAALTDPHQAAETVLVNMLTEVIERVGRFSPWYTLPARAFGLTRVRNPRSHRSHWELAPEAAQKWEQLLLPLSTAIENNSGLIQAVILVDGLMDESHPFEPLAMAVCGCQPARAIQIKPAILEQAGIRCDCCSQPFRLVGPLPGSKTHQGAR